MTGQDDGALTASHLPAEARGRPALAASPALRRLAWTDGRALVAVAVIVFFATLLGVRTLTGSVPWRTVGVDKGAVSFEDLRAVTSSWNCASRGIQTFPYNPCDPFAHGGAGIKRATNYPRLWAWFWHLGLRESVTVPLGIAIAAVFFLSALAVAGPLTLGEGAVYGAAVLSSAPLLGVERGNVDMLMFALVAAAVLLVRRSPWGAAVAVVAAGVLKLFPAAAIVLFARGRRRLAAGVVAAAALLAYGIATLGDLRTIRHVIPRIVGDSYGSGVLAEALDGTGVSWLQRIGENHLREGTLALAVVLAIALVSRRGHRPRVAERSLRLDAFWAGAAIYAVSYVFGWDFDYRLSFLIFCVPQLCTWVRPGRSPLAGARVALTALLLTLWLSSMAPPLPFGLQTWYLDLPFPPEEALNWFLFAWLLAGIASTAEVALPRRLTWRTSP